MYEARFSTWRAWVERNHHERIARPGVYAIALTSQSLSGRAFSWRKDIIYVGMTNGLAGLKGRLQQFDRTMAGKLSHGGADRVRFKHRDYDKFTKRAYVSVAPFECDPGSNLSGDLRIMGDVARFEFYCLAHFVERFHRLPKFNDKKAAPKLSKSRLTKSTATSR